jgi:hypothetical protein
VLIKLVNLWAASRLDESHTVRLVHDRQTRGVTYRIALKILKKINLSEPGSILSLRWWSVLTAPRGAADDNWQSGA